GTGVFDHGDGGAVDAATHPGQTQVRRPGRDVLERGALQVDQRALARRVHDLEDALTSVGREEVEVVVVLAGEGPRRGLESVEVPREKRRPALVDRRRQSTLQLHRADVTARLPP